MKKFYFMVMLQMLFFVGTLHSQMYYINFKGFGFSNSVDSVIVQNLTQNTFMTIYNTDTLLLYGNMGINTGEINEFKTIVNPNPFNEKTTVELLVSKVRYNKSKYTRHFRSCLV